MDFSVFSFVEIRFKNNVDKIPSAKIHDKKAHEILGLIRARYNLQSNQSLQLMIKGKNNLSVILPQQVNPFSICPQLFYLSYVSSNKIKYYLEASIVNDNDIFPKFSYMIPVLSAVNPKICVNTFLFNFPFSIPFEHVNKNNIREKIVDSLDAPKGTVIKLMHSSGIEYIPIYQRNSMIFNKNDMKNISEPAKDVFNNKKTSPIVANQLLSTKNEKEVELINFLRGIIAKEFFVVIELDEEVVNKINLRINTIKELITSEKIYYCKLEEIKQFTPPFFVKMVSQKLITQDQFNSFYFEVDRLIGLHILIDEAFERGRLDYNFITEIGGIFKKFAKCFYVYKDIVNMFQKVILPKINEASTHNKMKGDYIEFIKKTGENLTIDSLIINIIQRVPRYPLFLDQLLKATPELHPDFSNCKICNDEIKKSLKKINESIHDFDLQNYIMKLNNTLVMSDSNKATIPRNLQNFFDLTKLPENLKFEILFFSRDVWILRNINDTKRVIEGTFDYHSISVEHIKGDRVYIRTHFQNYILKADSESCAKGIANIFSISCSEFKKHVFEFDTVDQSEDLLFENISSVYLNDDTFYLFGGMRKLTTQKFNSAKCSEILYGTNINIHDIIQRSDNESLYFNKSMFLYVLSTNKITEMKPLNSWPCERHKAAITTFGKKIYIFGGESVDRKSKRKVLLNDLWIYEDFKFIKVEYGHGNNEVVPPPGDQYVMTFFKNTLYLIGGNDMFRIFMLNTLTNKWSILEVKIDSEVISKKYLMKPLSREILFARPKIDSTLITPIKDENNDYHNNNNANNNNRLKPNSPNVGKTPFPRRTLNSSKSSPFIDCSNSPSKDSNNIFEDTSIDETKRIDLCKMTESGAIIMINSKLLYLIRDRDEGRIFYPKFTGCVPNNLDSAKMVKLGDDIVFFTPYSDYKYYMLTKNFCFSVPAYSETMRIVNPTLCSNNLYFWIIGGRVEGKENEFNKNIYRVKINGGSSSNSIVSATNATKAPSAIAASASAAKDNEPFVDKISTKIVENEDAELSVIDTWASEI